MPTWTASNDSPGADGNASEVAAVLETARLLSLLPVAPIVLLAVFGMEGLGLIGARRAVRELIGTYRPRGMIGPKSVEAGTQRLLAGFAGGFPQVAAAREWDMRGDLTLVVHRPSSAAAAARWRRAAAEHSAPPRPAAARPPGPTSRSAYSSDWRFSL